MKVLVVLPAARGQYPTEAEQRRADAMIAYSTPEVAITVGFPAEEYAEGIGALAQEGMGCALTMAEAWVRKGTPYSRLRYLEPR